MIRVVHAKCAEGLRVLQGHFRISSNEKSYEILTPTNPIQYTFEFIQIIFQGSFASK